MTRNTKAHIRAVTYIAVLGTSVVLTPTYKWAGVLATLIVVGPLVWYFYYLLYIGFGGRDER